MKLRALIAFITALSLAGCTAFENVNDTMKRATAQGQQATDMLASLRTIEAQPKRNTVVFSDSPWIATQPIEIAKNETPPQLKCDITYDPRVPQDIMSFGQYVTRQCGVSVRVTSDALAFLSGGYRTGMNSQGAASAQGGPANASIPQLPRLPQLPGFASTQGAGGAYGGSFGMGAQSTIVDVKYHGMLRGLLDTVTSKFGLSYRYDKDTNVASIFYLDTKTFQIYAISRSTDMKSQVTSGTTTSAGVSGGTGAGSGGGTTGGISGDSGSNQTTTVTVKDSVSDSLTGAINAMLTPNVGHASPPAFGTITVTDTPEVLARVGDFIKMQNTNLTKQVLLNVKILSVQLTDSDSLGIDWKLVYQNLSGFGFGLANTIAAEAAATTGTIGIVGAAAGTTLGKFNGSSLIVSALSQQGRVSVVTSPSVTTLNLQPVPVQVATQTGYLAQVSSTQTAQVGTSTALTPGTVTTGFNMNLLPYIMPGGEVLLQYSINLSALNQLRKVSSGGSSIEIPEVANRIFSQEVKLRSGQTLVLSGFDQVTDNGSRSGVGSARNMLLGGSANTNNGRDVIVVLITPTLME
ncbi:MULTISPECIES: PilN family type IVB pilus formation outer membrane protein [Burkholderia cepacia complex]|uniref:PilN family type IVB pilus formation outer membrane protein n=1 Tax=Burkholderia contaminans TaxID=488447 RepID=A0A2S5DM68_9BURK|nr:MULTISPECIES: PilN family type IVB pilus formation outer membrane protein [Burkholderia cepacia complex]KVR89452.1 pilus assembly protein PilN [Burkholderia vietnamiensis]POZ80172.1 PilN family type IVB pilus formation outer membrane protein [Burkholderia contaminans]HDR9133898.1 PilN family type IVB pilus formation outer membrane protein [Burkholderia vietnamiensis]